jgi:prephenate dehydrogenase
MAIQLTILGLGQIGSSVGLALQEYKDKIYRVGHDKSRQAVNLAKENDAVDKTALTLAGAVKDADIVLLALPFQEIYPVLEFIAQDLKEDVLVLDTAPLKSPVIGWAKELLPEKSHYVGLLPVIKAEYLGEIEHGPETAHADLFKDNLMAVVTSHTASKEAIDTASNFAQLVGATPYFADPMEIDGVISMTHLLPEILAAAMLDISQNAPGWREGRKLAGKSFSQMTNSFGKDEIAGALASAIAFNPENTKRLINDMIRVLVELRDLDAAPTTEELTERFESLQQGRDVWLDDRQEGSWTDVKKGKLPERENMLSRLLGFRIPKPKREDE